MSPQPYLIPGGGEDLVLADLNRDGSPDAITTNQTNKTLTIFLGIRGFFGTGYVPDLSVSDTGSNVSPRRVVTADFNRDGFLDIVSANCPASISALYGNGNATFQPFKFWTMPSLTCANSLSVVSLPGDSLPDLLISRDTGGSGDAPIVLLENKGQGQWQVASNLYVPNSTKVLAATAADFDGDGILDVAAVAQSGSSAACVQLLFPFTAKQPREISCVGRAEGIVAAQLNDDARPDLVVPYSSSTDKAGVVTLLNAGGGKFTSKTLITILGQWKTSAKPSVADFTGDGLPDIAIGLTPVSPLESRAYAIFISTNNGEWNTSYVSYGVDGADLVGTATADVDLDGKPDLAILAAPDVWYTLTNVNSVGGMECVTNTPGVNICGPFNGATLNSPVFVSAAAAGTSGSSIVKTRTYVDDRQVGAGSSELARSSIDASIGTHNVVINAWDSNGKLFQTRSTFTVGHPSVTCASSAVGVRICVPTGTTQVDSPFALSATAKGNAKITAMKAYVDGVRVASNNAAWLSNLIGTTPGSHKLTVNAWDSTGAVYSSNVAFTTQACANPISATRANICAPLLRTTSPVPISVTPKLYGDTVTLIRVSLDNGPTVCQGSGPSLACRVSVAPGEHFLGIETFGAVGNNFTTGYFFTVLP